VNTRKVMHFVAEYGIFVALAGLFCFLAISKSDTFFTTRNLTNVLRQNSHTVILATGMTLVILTAGIDLSVGAIVALAGVVCADMLVKGHGVFFALCAGVAVGGVAGLTTGVFITRVRIPPFVATLAMMLVVRGAALKYTDARSIAIPPAIEQSFSALSNGITPVLIMAGVLVVVWVVLARTRFGRHIYAVGGNPEAARLSGIRVNRVLLGVYAGCGLLAGLAGVLVASRIGSGYPQAGELYELDAIAATVVGGTSLFGGRGSIVGTLAGAFFIGILNNGLNLYQVGSYEQMILKGVVLLGATSLDLWRGKDQS